MRSVLIFAFVGVWAYAMFCGGMIMLHRQGGRGKWLVPSWSGKNLSEAGLAYRRRYFVSVLFGGAIALLWFMLVEPLEW